MNDLRWFVRICDWEMDHLADLISDAEEVRPVFQAISAKLMGLDK